MFLQSNRTMTPSQIKAMLQNYATKGAISGVREYSFVSQFYPIGRSYFQSGRYRQLLGVQWRRLWLRSTFSRNLLY